MRIMEVFDSWQGEGCNMGKYCTFIRFSGCSLCCSWCDTKQSWKQTQDIGVEEFLSHHEGKLQKNIVITGGEPTEQPEELTRLVRRLHDKGHRVMLESNGTYEYYADLHCDWVTCSPKPKAMYCVFMQGVDELKYVVTEYFNADTNIPEEIRKRFEGRIWLQPCDMGDFETNSKLLDKAMAISQQDSRLRLGVQMHKMWGVR